MFWNIWKNLFDVVTKHCLMYVWKQMCALVASHLLSAERGRQNKYCMSWSSTIYLYQSESDMTLTKQQPLCSFEHSIFRLVSSISWRWLNRIERPFCQLCEISRGPRRIPSLTSTRVHLRDDWEAGCFLPWKKRKIWFSSLEDHKWWR